MIKVIDLFAGCGGLSLGLTQAKFNILAGIDNWPASIEIYQLNFSHPAVAHDLSDVEATVDLLNGYEFDLIAGGPPCQDFSSAGKRNLEGGRADLTYKFADIVETSSPEFFIMENVERIRKSHILYDVLDQLASAGYGLTAVILDASYCGAPQARSRFFLVGRKNEKHNFLLGHLKLSLRKIPMTMKEYFGSELGTEYYYRHPRNYNRRGIYSLNEPSATIRGVNRPIPPGYEIHPNDPVGINLSSVRPLTSDERARVQTFPASFKWLGPKTAREQMIGNAVPVALAKFVGDALTEYIKSGSIPFKNELALEVEDSILVPTRTLDRGFESMTHYVPKENVRRKSKSSSIH